MAIPNHTLAAAYPRGRAHLGGRPRSVRKRSRVGPWALFFLLHVPLVLAVKSSSPLATVHALCTVAAGLRALKFRTPERVIYVMGYVIASEPLWRVSRAMVFYEMGKYLIAGLSILAIVRFRLLSRSDKAPLIYFLLLMPSFLVLTRFDRQLISFNMSGPFSLATSCMFLSTQRLSARVLAKLFLVIIAPIMGLAFAASFATLTTEISNYQASKVASAGLGQNQASTIFGLGLVLAFFYLYVERHDRPLRWMTATIGLWCGVQAGMTFSRGGLATAIGALAAASFFLLRDRRSRGTVILRVGLLTLLAAYVIVPQLNTFTSGAFGQRFSSTHLTGRDRIIKADIEAFRQNPLFGIGPGESKDYHGAVFRGRRFSAHTEYSRLLAEHGIWGVAAMLVLAWMSAKRLRRRAPLAAAFTAGFTVWTLLYMFHAAMRTAAATFLFALGAAHLMAAAPDPAALGRRIYRRLRPSPLDQQLARQAHSADDTLRSGHRSGNRNAAYPFRGPLGRANRSQESGDRGSDREDRS